MNRLLFVVCLCVSGCHAAFGQEIQNHQLAKTRTVEDVLERTVAELEALNAKVDETNRLLKDLSDQLRTTANQQCDILNKMSETAPAPVSAPAPAELEVDTPDGQRFNLNEFINTWYKGGPAIEQAVIQPGAELSSEVLTKLNSAITSREQALGVGVGAGETEVVMTDTTLGPVLDVKTTVRSKEVCRGPNCMQALQVQHTTAQHRKALRVQRRNR